MARKGKKKREEARKAKIEAMVYVPLAMPPLKVSAPSTKMKGLPSGSPSPVHKIGINLSMACPATGFVKSSCGCPRCKVARKNSKRVR